MNRTLDIADFCFYGLPENDGGGYFYFGPDAFDFLDFPYGPHPDELQRRGAAIQNLEFLQEEEEEEEDFMFRQNPYELQRLGAAIQSLDMWREEEENGDSSSDKTARCSSSECSCLANGLFRFRWVGTNKKYIRVEKHGKYIQESLGCSSGFDDPELEVLASLEAAVSSEVHYPLYQTRVREQIEKVYRIKHQLDGIENVRNTGEGCRNLYDNASAEEMERVRAIHSLCNASSEGIALAKSILDEHRMKEWTASCALNVLSCAVYKLQLQQLDLEYKTNHWKSWKQRVPARSLPAINIILRGVVPFLFD